MEYITTHFYDNKKYTVSQPSYKKESAKFMVV